MAIMHGVQDGHTLVTMFYVSVGQTLCNNELQSIQTYHPHILYRQNTGNAATYINNR